MQDKIQEAIEAINALMAEDEMANRPRVVSKLNTMRRYLVDFRRQYERCESPEA